MTDTPDRPRCATCAHWWAVPDCAPGPGSCRMAPPTAGNGWPMTYADQGCSQHSTATYGRTSKPWPIARR